MNIIGYDPLWRDRSKARFHEEHFTLIREAGFNNVRMVLQPFVYAKLDKDNTISDDWFKTLDICYNTRRGKDRKPIICPNLRGVAMKRPAKKSARPRRKAEKPFGEYVAVRKVNGTEIVLARARSGDALMRKVTAMGLSRDSFMVDWIPPPNTILIY